MPEWSLQLKVELETTNMQEVFSMQALVDIYNINGTANKAGTVKNVVEAVLCYDGHTKQALFAVTSLGKQDMILGYTWLKEHNPEINWTTNSANNNPEAAKFPPFMEEEPNLDTIPAPHAPPPGSRFPSKFDHIEAFLEDDHM
ncbi:hypothetical protein DXG03_004705 [Asterophora parasitica]|uniref:Uncharacterized protein n=1 Tax=Asterophora parasitica TaxID=117018 RepID=A0A9P7K698_9AGAR|nr:hypothetical protein DXG03_004705 [Asterophora parasitica]